MKFKKVSQAAKATERAEDIRLLLDCPALKVAFADHLRRKNVVGDSIDYENVDFNCNKFVNFWGRMKN